MRVAVVGVGIMGVVDRAVGGVMAGEVEEVGAKGAEVVVVVNVESVEVVPGPRRRRRNWTRRWRIILRVVVSRRVLLRGRRLLLRLRSRIWGRILI